MIYLVPPIGGLPTMGMGICSWEYTIDVPFVVVYIYIA